ncbi:uncharacterized protein [Argopecten irradians]|uniref:uncharacterized protein n=1 Tax=Argopecten irradians TaxID=31199 RepID=UPI0037162119
MDLDEYQSRYQEIKGKEFLPMKEEYVASDFLMDMSEFLKQETNGEVYVPNMESRLNFYISMNKDPETWTTKEEAEYEILQNNLKLIEEKLHAITEKKTKLETLKTKHREVLSRLGDGLTCMTEFYNQKKQQEEKLAKITSSIELCETTINRVRDEKQSLEETCQRLRITWEAQQQHQIQDNHSLKSKVKALEDKLNRHKEMLTFMKQQSKVSIKQRSDFGHLVLELLNDEDKEDIPRMFLTARVEQDNFDLEHLTKAEKEAGNGGT